MTSRILLCVLLAGLLAVSVAARKHSSRSNVASVAPKVKTEQGICIGATASSYNGRKFYAYKGIPYAQPPIGMLRFKGPKPLPPGVGQIDASKDGPMCTQKNYLLPTPALSGQEDCLYLNVFTPKVGAKKKLPVMVYIHGGGWFTGTGASYINGPDYLMDKNVVLVTFNYRLGALGFLSTGDAHAPGNYGMKDQTAVLRWVKSNIAAFGGDPGLVTIFGQSAGAASVHYHMLSPMSRGLFHRAISQSSTALVAWAWPGDTLPVARMQARFVDCPQDDTAEMVNCLRKVDANKLTDSGDNFHFWSIDPLVTFVPVVETLPSGDEEPFMVQDPMKLIKEGKFAKVPWMLGVVAQEGIIRGLPIVSNPNLLADLNANWTTLGPQIMEIERSVGKEHVDAMWNNITKFYLNDELPVQTDKALGFINLYSDRSFVHGVHKAAMLHIANGHNNIYMYKFDYAGSHSYATLFAQNPTKYGVSHCDDLIYLFRSPLLFPDWPHDHPDVKVKDVFITLWTKFAKHGNPTPQVSVADRNVSCSLQANSTTTGKKYSCDLSHLSWTPLALHEDPSKLHTSYLHIKHNTNNTDNTPILDFTMEQDLFKSRMEFWDSSPLVENSARGLPSFHTVQV